MFERYSEKARRVIFFARYFAAQSGSPDIESEILLMGLLREDKGLGNRFLGSPWVAEEVWKKIQQRKPAREKFSGPVDIPLSSTSKRVLTFAVEEAELLSSKVIRTEHILLGLLREEGCLAAEILHEYGVGLTETRGELLRVPNTESGGKEFVRELGPRPPEVAELKNKIKSIRERMEEAIRNHDFASARAYSEGERGEQDKLFALYRQYELDDWIYGLD
ncbi:MAG TPA: Clp protease N-terminal domain-containing protein [Candidatus Acidoferrum sp.]|nr:Clp protease N-terminal domain-containing protein [Candidatus Acidoferrum sp.]